MLQDAVGCYRILQDTTGSERGGPGRLMFRPPAPNPAGHLVVVVGGVRTARTAAHFGNIPLFSRFFEGKA